MKKTIKIFLLSLLMLIATMSSNSVNAASASISASSTRVSKGKNVTITASVNAGAWNLTLSGAGQSKGLVGQTSKTSNSSASTSISFTPTKTGTYTFYLTGDISDFVTDITSNVSKQITITVVEPTSSSSGGSSGGKTSSGGSSNKNTPTEEKEKSKDSTLSALTVKEGKIDPEFKKDVKEYKLTIPYETSEINVTATPADSKASVAVKGNKDLKEGENTVTVTVTAEDGSTSDYVIKVTRSRVPLALKSLVIKYENQEGELIELPLNPGFAFDILEYSLEDLEYWVNNLSIEAVSNIDGAEIDIQGADNIQTGENTITISLKVMEDAKNLKEGEEPKEETISYTIKVNKKEEPTLLTKISDWFKGIFSNISNWYDQNEEEVIIGALGVCNVALLGLSAYIVVDYRKYKDIIKKVKSDKKNDILEEDVSEKNIIEEIHKTTNNAKEEAIDDKSNTDEENNIDEGNKKGKPKGGKHF